MAMNARAAVILALLSTAGCGSRPAPAPATETAPRFGAGRPATSAEVAAWDKDVNGAGDGLPPGSGNAVRGAELYRLSCASCHGPRGEGGTGSQLIQPKDPAVRARRNVGSHWPYAPPLFDYIRRTMPPDRPWSLSDDEVYSLVAYLLAGNGIIDGSRELDAALLRRVRMPSRDRFVRDDRKGGPVVK